MPVTPSAKAALAATEMLGFELPEDLPHLAPKPKCDLQRRLRSFNKKKNFTKKKKKKKC